MYTLASKAFNDVIISKNVLDNLFYDNIAKNHERQFPLGYGKTPSYQVCRVELPIRRLDHSDLSQNRACKSHAFSP